MKIEITTKPPPLNQIYRAKKLKDGRVIYYKTQKAKDWTELIKWESYSKAFRNYYYALIKLKVEIFWTGREPDIDAYLKLLLDTLEDWVYENDKQIVELIVTKQKSKNPKKFKMIVNIEKISDSYRD